MSCEARHKWASRATDFCWRSWDADEHVVYHTVSGDTHLLNGVAAAVLRCLQKESVSTEELVGRVSHTLSIEPTLEFKREIERLLDRFDQLGLIELVP